MNTPVHLTLSLVAEQLETDESKNIEEQTSTAICPSPSSVQKILCDILNVLFPKPQTELSAMGVKKVFEKELSEIFFALENEIAKAFASKGIESPKEKATSACEAFISGLPNLKRVLREDVQAAYEGDPAASSKLEVVLAYPGLHAITVHRIAHSLYVLNVPYIPRIMSEFAHSRTGIDIHPGAKIGDHFFIDHGTGVVIGETTVIGRNVKIYQGVTLGALSFQKDKKTGMLVKNVKRHPNVEDDVVIYAGATILGGKTTIGQGSVIGGNVWLTKSVPPNTSVYNKPPTPIIIHSKTK